MSIKKKNTREKHERIFKNVQNLTKTGKANSTWDACYKVAKKMKMSHSAILGAYYNLRKEKDAQETKKQIQIN